MEKCKIGIGVFWVKKGQRDKIVIETKKTIEVLEKTGHTVKICKPNYKTYEDGVLWIIAYKEKKERFTFGFFIDKESRKLKNTFVTVHDKSPIYEHFIMKYKKTSITSEANNPYYALTYLQKERVKLVF